MPSKSPSPLQITILSTTQDIASINIKQQLLSLFPFSLLPSVEPWDPNFVMDHYIYHPKQAMYSESSHIPPVEFHLITIDQEFITLDDYISPDQIYGDLVIYASRHRSQSERKALLCHTTGNLDSDNSFGGEANRVSKGSGLLTHYLYTSLHAIMQATPNYNVPIDHEVDHHGPTRFSQPSAFIELGSTETGWQDPIGAQVVAKSIIRSGEILSLQHYDPKTPGILYKHEIQIVVGFGGSHYMPSFQPLILNNYGFVHTVPKYKVMAITSEKLTQLVDQSFESVDYWVVDWKGLNSAEKQHLIPLLEASSRPFKKAKALRKLIQ